MSPPFEKSAQNEGFTETACAALFDDPGFGSVPAVLAGCYSSQRQGISGVSSQTFSLRNPGFIANHIRPQNHRDHLVLRVAVAHAFAAYAAIGRNDQALGRDVAQRFADQVRDLIRPLDLQSMMINNADDHLLAGDGLADRRKVCGARKAGLERYCVSVDFV
jgi:hypothetical protein